MIDKFSFDRSNFTLSFVCSCGIYSLFPFIVFNYNTICYNNLNALQGSITLYLIVNHILSIPGHRLSAAEKNKQQATACCGQLPSAARSRSLRLWSTWLTQFSRAKYESSHLYSVGCRVTDTFFSFVALAESISLKRWKSNHHLKGFSYPGIIC